MFLKERFTLSFFRCVFIIYDRGTKGSKRTNSASLPYILGVSLRTLKFINVTIRATLFFTKHDSLTSNLRKFFVHNIFEAMKKVSVYLMWWEFYKKCPSLLLK